MEIELNRRSFLRGGLAALGWTVVPGTCCFAAPPGWRPEGAPELVFGFITDSHIRRDGNPKKETVWPRTTTKALENAFTFFRDQKVDAVVHGGDMAHRGLACELRFHADLWFRIFPDDKLPNGRKVERIFVTGNHEWFRNDPFAERVYPDPDRRREAVLANDMARHWQEVWHEPYERVWHKTVKGYHFFGEHFEDRFGDVEKRIRTDARALVGKKPFFILHHIIPDHRFCERLADFPNAVMLFGHWHNSSAHLGTIHHDTFPMINGPSLRGNDLPETPGYKPDKATRCPHDEIQHGYLIRVYRNVAVFERRDFYHGGKVGPDLVLPLGVRDRKPFSREELIAVTGAPAFAAGAAPRVSSVSSGLAVEIPAAVANPRSRVYLYDIRITGEAVGPSAVRKCIYASGCDFAMDHPAAKAVTKVTVPVPELRSGKTAVMTVFPVSSLGVAGKEMTMKITV